VRGEPRSTSAPGPGVGRRGRRANVAAARGSETRLGLTDGAVRGGPMSRPSSPSTPEASQTPGLAVSSCTGRAKCTSPWGLRALPGRRWKGDGRGPARTRFITTPLTLAPPTANLFFFFFGSSWRAGGQARCSVDVDEGPTARWPRSGCGGGLPFKPGTRAVDGTGLHYGRDTILFFFPFSPPSSRCVCFESTWCLYCGPISATRFLLTFSVTLPINSQPSFVFSGGEGELHSRGH